MSQIEINVYSPIFSDFLNHLNAAILQCVREIYADNFSGGEISAKINIDFSDEVEFYATGQDKEHAHHYKRPDIEHKVTLTMKKREEVKGGYNEPLELVKDDERFVLVEVQKAQLALSDVDHLDQEGFEYD